MLTSYCSFRSKHEQDSNDSEGIEKLLLEKFHAGIAIVDENNARQANECGVGSRKTGYYTGE